MESKELFLKLAMIEDTKIIVYSCDKWIDLTIDNSQLRVTDGGEFYYFRTVMPISDYTDKGLISTDLLYSMIRILTKDK